MDNQSQEDYLKAIFLLIEKNNQNNIKSVEVAASLSVSKPAVSKMLRKLWQSKFIISQPYSDISLTKKGFKKAKMLVYKHRLIEFFLEKKLKIKGKNIHREAHKLEHTFSDKTIFKLAEFLGNPEFKENAQFIGI